MRWGTLGHRIGKLVSRLVGRLVGLYVAVVDLGGGLRGFNPPFEP